MGRSTRRERASRVPRGRPAAPPLREHAKGGLRLRPGPPHRCERRHLPPAAHALRRSGPASLRVLSATVSSNSARLTTGKTTHEVEDITDFLIASGYDLNRVLEFLEPVRHATRFADLVKDRPYAAFIAENGELVNLGGVVSEGFLRDLEAEWGELPMAEGEAFGTRWLLLATAPASELAPGSGCVSWDGAAEGTRADTARGDGRIRAATS